MLKRFWKNKPNPRRQPVQEVIIAVLNAGINEDSALDRQLQSMIKAEEMASGPTGVGPDDEG